MSESSVCANCGVPGNASDKFCGSCGAPRDPAPVPVTVAAAPVTPPAATFAEPVVPRANIDPHAFDGPARDRAFDAIQAFSVYLGARDLYNKVPEPSFDPVRSGRYFIEIAKHAAIYFLAWWVTGLIAWIMCLFVALATKSGAIFVLYFLGAGATALALIALWLFMPIPAMLSDWKLALDDKGASRDKTFEHIAWSFGRRQAPVSSTRVRRISQPQAAEREYLEIKDGVFLGYVSCFAYGEDLYVGWTFWLYLSPLRWALMWIMRIVHTLTHRGTELMITLRYETARAMREAMHLSCLDGVDVANGEADAHGDGIIGANVAVELTSLAAD